MKISSLIGVTMLCSLFVSSIGNVNLLSEVDASTNQPTKAVNGITNIPELRTTFVKLENQLDLHFCFAPEKDLKGEQECLSGKHPSFIYASGVIVHHEERSSIVLTAGHFCTTTLRTIDKMIQNDPYILPDKPEGKELVDIRWDETYIAKDISGAVFPLVLGAYVYDEQKRESLDICAVTTHGKVPVPVAELAVKKPMPGERIVNIAAPHAIWAPHSVPIFEGFFAGGHGPHRGVMYTGWRSAPGSSGSPIFVQRDGVYKLAGVLHSMDIRPIGVSYGSTLGQTSYFINRFIKKLGPFIDEQVATNITWIEPMKFLDISQSDSDFTSFLQLLTTMQKNGHSLQEIIFHESDTKELEELMR